MSANRLELGNGDYIDIFAEGRQVVVEVGWTSYGCLGMSRADLTERQAVDVERLVALTRLEVRDG